MSLYELQQQSQAHAQSVRRHQSQMLLRVIGMNRRAILHRHVSKLGVWGLAVKQEVDDAIILANSHAATMT
jgi:hypothetical protein